MIIRPLTVYTNYTPVDPYNPLNLPAYTIRLKFSSGYTPTEGDSQTLVDAEENIWDITKNSTSWSELFKNNMDIIEIIGANSRNITNVDQMFRSAYSVESGALALYQQLSTQPNTPESHYRTFRSCGAFSVTGSAEVNQIPDDWK